MDVFLTPSRWKQLVKTIRETCLVEYLRPYQRVKLESLRDLFYPNSANCLDSVIDAVADLMDRKLLPPTTRLDCRENILFQTEPPCDPTPKIRSMEERILDDSHAMLVRLSCLENDLSVHSDPLGSKLEGVARRQRHLRMRNKAIDDSRDSDTSYENQVEGRGGSMGDTHMIDAEPSPHVINSAMNPEDMY